MSQGAVLESVEERRLDKGHPFGRRFHPVRRASERSRFNLSETRDTQVRSYPTLQNASRPITPLPRTPLTGHADLWDIRQRLYDKPQQRLGPAKGRINLRQLRWRTSPGRLCSSILT